MLDYLQLLSEPGQMYQSCFKVAKHNQMMLTREKVISHNLIPHQGPMLRLLKGQGHQRRVVLGKGRQFL